MDIRKFTIEDLRSVHKDRSEYDASRPDYILQKQKPKALASTLNEYVPSESKPWDARRVKHAKRRVEFGVHHSQVNGIMSQPPSKYVDDVITLAKLAQDPPNPSWYDATPPWQGTQADIDAYFEQNFQNYIEYLNSWLSEMRANPFKEKMVLFWSNHFVTQFFGYDHAALSVRYVNVLRRNFLGNFKTMVHEIGLDPAMLYYLNGHENFYNRYDPNWEPNENYARELLELFTMGVGNYTQNDIIEIARALTGYYVDYRDWSVNYNYYEWHDRSNKTVFGQTGAYQYDDVLDVIFEQRAQEIANFICTKLYRFFVYNVPNQSIIDGLAQTFINSNWELEPVVAQLLKSEHFYDDEIIGAMFKSPVDVVQNFYQEMATSPRDDFELYEAYVVADMNQYLLNPPNVAGWKGHRDWLSTTTMPRRWNMSDFDIFVNNDQATLNAFARGMSDPSNPTTLANDIADAMLAVPLPENERALLPGILLGNLQPEEWNVYSQSAYLNVRNLVIHLRKLPEYQHL